MHQQQHHDGTTAQPSRLRPLQQQPRREMDILQQQQSGSRQGQLGQAPGAATGRGRPAPAMPVNRRETG